MRRNSLVRSLWMVANEDEIVPPFAALSSNSLIRAIYACDTRLDERAFPAEPL